MADNRGTGDTEMSQGFRLGDLLKTLRVRWIIVVGAALAGVLGGVAMTLFTTPLYQASTRLFVSTTAGATAGELYQGNRLSQERVLSYTELLMGKTLAQRTIDKLSLDVSVEAMQRKVKANAKLDTVLINVKVLDPSPIRARDIANALSDEFVVMVRELETPRSGATPDARVVVEERASVPAEPVVPHLAQNMAFGLILGLLSGIGLAFLRDALDNTIKDQATVEQITGRGMVGAIPSDKLRRSETAIPFETENSAIAESFRKLRTNLQFLAVDHPPRVIVVTSAMPNEGKSTTAVNIALALAEAEYKVLIVDGDLRRPSVDKYLDVVGSVGLSTVVSGRASLAEALQDTKFPHLTVLAAGATPPNPSELLGSLAAKTLLNELRTQFDYIIVDTSPLLAVTDAAVLAVNCDGTLIMARFGETKRDQLAQSVRMLEDVGATLLGSVLTMMPSHRRGTYGYYGYYGYGGKGSVSTSNEEVVAKSNSSGPAAGQKSIADER
jgi:capsular exopolysaccharide synthesis family protein